MELNHYFPRISKSEAEIRNAIQAGADRLLSMQTPEGGLSYWCGGKDPNLWASTLGGSVLLLAKNHGATVPESAIKALGDWLSQSLRGAVNAAADELQNAAAASYTLALLGRAEPGYLEKLYQRRSEMSTVARCYLALALAITGGDKAQAVELLTGVSHQESSWRWNNYDYASAMKLHAWCLVKPEGEETAAALQTLMGKRHKRGDWANTYCNGWALTALSSYVTKVEGGAKPAELELSGMFNERIALTQDAPTRYLEKILDGSTPLSLCVEGVTSGRAYVSVKIVGQPPLDSIKPLQNGLAVDRTYTRLLPDGSTAPLGEPKVGDLVRVLLRASVPDDVDYVVIDDPLPATFEAINQKFASQAAALPPALGEGWSRWRSDHEEMRDDRALFFCDSCRAGQYQVEYLARVTGVGETTAPQTKIEAMYDPAKFGLGGTQRIATRPREELNKTLAQ